MSREFIKYYEISPSVTAFCTTRHGGVSSGAYAQFNINRYCGDDKAHVRENLELLGRELGVGVDNVVMPHQTHGDEVRQIGEDFLSLPPEVKTLVLEGVDALTTSLTGVCIGVSTADCIPVIIYDHEHHAAAVVHAGWRGTVKRIVQKAVMSMRLSYHSRPECLRAVIGPGISLDAFEVDDDVYEEFASAGFDMGVISSRKDKWHVDLKKCNSMQLASMGVPDVNIYVSDICTYADSADYFSARRLGARSGRMFTGVVLR